VLVVASSYTVTTLTPSALVDVVMGISRFAVVDDVFTDRGRLVPLGGGLVMNRGLSLSRREGTTGFSEASPRRLEAELSACCMAAASRSSRISS
jgi:hypothetical protein